MANNGLLGYVDALSGGSISKVGLFSLGIIPYINASIVLQLFSAAFPSLKKMQREDGPQGRARFQWYQKVRAGRPAARGGQEGRTPLHKKTAWTAAVLPPALQAPGMRSH